MQIKLYLFLIVASLSQGLLAQTSCLNTLREARELYEEGLIDEIPDLLSACMESGFTRGQRVEAYKLIILAYLFDDDQFAAEKMMDEFLRKFPEYEVLPNDPVEFVYLLESYKTSSAYTLNLTFGPTFSNQRILEPYSANDISNTRLTSHTGTGFQVGFGISRTIWKPISGNLEVFYSTHQYSSGEEVNISVNNEINSSATIEVNEELKKIDLPLSASYNFGIGNLNYTIRLGGMISFISDASLSIVREQSGIDVTMNVDELSGNRVDLSYGVFTGIGIEYKIPRGFIVLDIRYNAGLNNMVLAGRRYESPHLYSRGAYVDDDFALDYMSLAIGYHFSIYQSRKSRY
jgi:hypothetical protein